ncbi:MAG TPA: inositol monophosphatase family protein [Solirubrobacteraceae bacterium]|nr:inositol monophosphatase family protein [Solirubrobacteraceae bacterium]
MTSDETLSADWLGVCRRAAAALEDVLARAPTTLQRAEETGERGEGGDRTLVIDRDAEDAVFALLDELHGAGHRFCAVSEERGIVDYGSHDVRVVVDPIDGSLNAKRGLPHHAISIAVADGPTMADVAFAFVHDYGPGEEWVARRGAGAALNGRPLDPAAPERRDAEGRLEVLGLESADPRWIAEVADRLPEHARRVRALGSIAVTLCQVAAARLDAMITLRRTRAVDAAAGQLIVREAGGHVAFPGFPDPLGAPLDVAPHSPLVAARSPEALAALARVPLA